MSIQETALYGDLVLALRDYAAEQLTIPDAARTLESARAQVDEFIRNWFFTPQADLYGSSPREVIWREQLGEPNILPKEYAAEAFDDDCPLCQSMRQEIAAAEDGVDHGHHWTYCPDSCLLDRYDPEGSEERWNKELGSADSCGEETAQPAAMAYEPLPFSPPRLDPEAFLSVLHRPWLDPELHRAAQQLAECCDVPLPTGVSGMPYRRITRDEAVSLISGLHRQGVDVQALLAQIEAWPYQKMALDWLSEPERNAAMVCQALEAGVDPDAESEATRFRHHRDFIFSLAQVMPLGARLWLSGWLEAVACGAMMGGGKE